MELHSNPLVCQVPWTRVRPASGHGCRTDSRGSGAQLRHSNHGTPRVATVRRRSRKPCCAARRPSRYGPGHPGATCAGPCRGRPLRHVAAVPSTYDPVPAERALPGRPDYDYALARVHDVLGTSMLGPFPAGVVTLYLGMGCFWGAEKRLWRLPGVHTTAVGYQGGPTPHPTYQEVCTGMNRARRDGHGRLRPLGGLHDRRAARLLGEPRPHPGHAAGKRRGHPVPQRGLLDHARAAGLVESSAAAYDEVLRAEGFDPVTTELGPPCRTGRSSCRSTTPRATTSSTCTRTRTGTTATPTPASCCRRSSDPGGLPPHSGLGQRGDGRGDRRERGGARGPGPGSQARHRTAAGGPAVPGRPVRTVHGDVHPAGGARGLGRGGTRARTRPPTPSPGSSCEPCSSRAGARSR